MVWKLRDSIAGHTQHDVHVARQSGTAAFSAAGSLAGGNGGCMQSLILATPEEPSDKKHILNTSKTVHHLMKYFKNVLQAIKRN